MARFVVLSAMLALSGCTFVAVYPTLTPSAKGLQSHTDYEAVVVTDELEATVGIEGYEKVGIGFIGPIVPLFPIAAGTGSDATVIVAMKLSPRRSSAAFSPDSVRLIVSGQVYAPTSTTIRECGQFAVENLDASSPQRFEGVRCFRFFFRTLPLPRDTFALVAKELPEIAYTVKLGTQGNFVRQ